MIWLGSVQRWWIIGFSLMLLAGSLAGPAMAQPQYNIEEIQDAFAKGDARALLAKASSRVEIALLGRSRLYSRPQAVYVIQDFFRRYPPEGFVVQSEDQEEGSWFATGRYRYKHAERPLQVYLRFRWKDDEWALHEVRVEERQ